MSKRVTGHIISHTHWDREWRTPLWSSRFRLKKMMDGLLETLESEPDYKAFLLDGQVIAVEDYLEFCPEKEGAVRKAIESGKLFIGPWYNLPDLYPICGEALVRNLLWGIDKAEKLGGCLDIGYTTFGWGQTAQFPQLLAGFGIDFIVTGKNVSKHRAPNSEFMWEAPDGTRLMTTRLGISKRNNFYFHMLMPMQYGKIYSDPTWGYQLGKNGFLFHSADVEGCCTELTLLPETKYHYEMIPSCMEDLLSTANHTLVSDHLFLGDGTDFSGVTPQLNEVIEKLNEASPDVNFVHSTLPDYVEVVKKSLDPETLNVVHGELRDGPASSLTGNALAVRMRLKTLNRKAQTLLCRYAEPFANLVESPESEFQQILLKKAWEFLLKSHSHDAINGVTTDKTADDIANRLQQVIELSGLIFNMSAEAVLSRLDLKKEGEDGLFLTLFNPLPYEISGSIEVVVDVPQNLNWKWVQPLELDGAVMPTQPLGSEELSVPVNVQGSRTLPWRVDRHSLMLDSGVVPALGYKTVRLTAGKLFDRSAKFWPQDDDFGSQLTGTNQMANEHMEVVVNGDGTLDVTHKSSGRIYKQLNFFEYSGDAGDYWQRAEPRKQVVVNTVGKTAEIRRTMDGPLMTRFEIRHELEVPAEVDRKTQCLKERRVRIFICSTVTMKKNSPFLEIETSLDNAASDCRFRVGIPTELNTDFSNAEGHFTVDRRPIALPRDARGICDAQMATLPMQHWVDLSDGKSGLAVLNRNLQEFEVTDDASRTLMLTLMRCTAMRICSEFRAPQSDPAQTGAQAHGRTIFQYAIYPHDGGWQAADTAGAAEKFNAPMKGFQHTRPEEGDLPQSASLLAVCAPLRISAVKKAENREGIIIRLFNPTDETVKGELSVGRPIRTCERVRLDEKTVQPCDIKNGRIYFTADKFKMITLRII